DRHEPRRIPAEPRTDRSVAHPFRVPADAAGGRADETHRERQLDEQADGHERDAGDPSPPPYGIREKPERRDGQHQYPRASIFHTSTTSYSRVVYRRSWRFTVGSTCDGRSQSRSPGRARNPSSVRSVVCSSERKSTEAGTPSGSSGFP